MKALFALLALVLLPSGLAAQARVLSSAEIAKAFQSIPSVPPTNREVLTEDKYALKVAVLENRRGPGELHETEDRLFFVLKGSGAVCAGGNLAAPKSIAPHELQGPDLPGCVALPMQPGSVISVPRGTPYRMEAEKSRVEFLVVRIR
ncbi:MAG TPA: hypothetical protein VGN16_13805 [Acidobacteriaceae bacterium]|jgi:mannose-6-phosphate isomerase-like protein (cupin superfamily)